MALPSSRFEVCMYGALDRRDELAFAAADQKFQWMSEADAPLKRHWVVYRPENPADFPAGVHAPERLHTWCDVLAARPQWYLRTYGRPLPPSAVPLAAEALVRQCSDIAVTGNIADLLRAMNYRCAAAAVFQWRFIRNTAVSRVHLSRQHLSCRPRAASQL